MSEKSTPYVDDDGDVIWKNIEGQYHRTDAPPMRGLMELGCGG